MTNVTLESRDIPDEDVARLKAGFLNEHKMPEGYTFNQWLSQVAWDYIMREVKQGDDNIANKQRIPIEAV